MAFVYGFGSITARGAVGWRFGGSAVRAEHAEHAKYVKTRKIRHIEQNQPDREKLHFIFLLFALG